MKNPEPYRMSPLETAWGLVLGEDPSPPDLPEAFGHGPVVALEQAVLPFLVKSPCCVSFSGGRDSSLLLAIGTRVARREGLADPVPVTCRFPKVTGMEESDWQELVVRHLGVSEWVVLEYDDELDCVGPYATDVMRRHGLLWPFNTHLHAPLFEQASGGSLLTGAGGDEVLSPVSASPIAQVLAGRRRPRRRDVLRVGFALSPQFVRRPILERRFPGDFPWLLPEAHTTIAKMWAAESATEPYRWDASRRWWRRRHYVRLMIESLGLVAADHNVAAGHPFADLAYVAEIARAGGRAGFQSRTDALRAFYPDVLPDQLLSRTSKANGNLVFWSRYAREFAASWDGRGIDETIVDLEMLSREWASPEPDPHTLSLLQAAWLATVQPSSSQ